MDNQENFKFRKNINFPLPAVASFRISDVVSIRLEFGQAEEQKSQFNHHEEARLPVDFWRVTEESKMVTILSLRSRNSSVVSSMFERKV